MGNARRLRKKYQGPAHPWQRKRIESERDLKREFGLKNKKEIWKMESIIKEAAANIKNLIASHTEQAEKEKKQIMANLVKLGLIPSGAKYEDVLDLKVNNVLDRRLQTIMYRKGLARTMKQARQFIVHQHIQVGGKTITMPSYIVPPELEATIQFKMGSELSKADHPERTPIVRAPKKVRAPAPEDRFGRRKRRGESR